MDILFTGANLDDRPKDQDNRPRGPILVVDRDQNVRATIESLLSLAGCEVRSAASAATGLEGVRMWQPALVFLDPRIRAQDPLDVIRAFWEAGQRRIPLVLLCSSELDIAGGADGMIAGTLRKPFDVRELFAITARFVTCRVE